jgi:CheY-like chemotaxis protein/anti-sigma regulatory factor (Ser/Thr protein kinase)
MVGERTAELLAIQERHARERRLAAIGQLAAGVMHDVNNALNPIMAAAYLLDRHADDPVAVREYAARIAKAAETGAATSARVGRFIRQDPLDDASESQVDLATLAGEVVAMMRPLWAERQTGGPIRLDLRLASAPAVGIAGEVRAAIMNLIHNALDATTEGGTITVETRTDGVESIVEVSDTGVGMTEHVREHAFEPFFSTKEATGSGLGLAEVYGIMKRHRGSAEIVSDPNEGAIVRLRFRTHSASPREMPLAVASSASSRRILLVEDNEDGREFLKLVLQSHGHLVESVATLSEGLSRLEASASDPFEVLISDIGLPDGSGWDLVRKARARWPHMRIGVVTGWEGSRAATTDADFVLRKPIPPADLVALVAPAS